MRHLFHRFLPFFILLLCLQADIQAAGFEYDVQINAPGEIKTLLQTNLTLVRVQGQERTTAEQVARLVDSSEEETRNLLSTLGYFSPQVDIRYQSDLEKTVITLQIDPGKPVRVRNVQLKLSGPAAESATASKLNQEIAQLWTLPVGTVYTQTAWSDGKNRVLRPLHEHAYASANLKHSEAQVDIEAEAVDLTLEIDSGPAYRFGPLSIHGLKYYPESLAREQAPFKPGDEYQSNALTDLQNNLQRLPHFSLALIDTKLPETEPYEAPVSIEIQEAPRHRIQPGVGYSSNTGLSGDLGYRYLNVADRGWISETKTSLKNSEQSVETSLTFPPVNAGYEHRVYSGYVHSDLQGVDSQIWRNGIARELGDFKLSRTWGLEYQVEKRQLDTGEINMPRTLALKYQWIRRDLDSVRDPHSGRLLQWESAAAIASLITDETFLRAYGRVVQYWPLPRKSILLARFEAGQTFARNEAEVPSDWLFRTGGSNSVRGYDYQSLGVAQGSSITPGRVMSASSLELQIPVHEQWRAAVFADHGSAALRWSELHAVTSVGTGARWISPVGVIGADLAYGIDYQQWRFHVALGLAF